MYLDDELVRRLEALAKRTGARRNAIIRQAVAAWVGRAGAEWPSIVAEWRRDPAAPRFDDMRSELVEPPADPFAPAKRRGKRPVRRKPRATGH